MQSSGSQRKKTRGARAHTATRSKWMAKLAFVFPSITAATSRLAGSPTAPAPSRTCPQDDLLHGVCERGDVGWRERGHREGRLPEDEVRRVVQLEERLGGGAVFPGVAGEKAREYGHGGDVEPRVEGRRRSGSRSENASRFVMLEKEEKRMKNVVNINTGKFCTAFVIHAALRLGSSTTVF
ncbi:hypothetical protein C8R44DRAFT_735057 [Mycena epipterygia]|nr:hypothetical protein C8R44DRAFT_735057 [Mycena epipterygia]